MENNCTTTNLYQLSPLYEFPNIEEFIDSDMELKGEEKEKIELLKNKKMFLMTNQRGHTFLINPTIYTFLKCFEEANSIEQVLNTFLGNLDQTSDAVEPIIMDFFKKMRKRNVLVKKEMAARILEKKDSEIFNYKTFESGAYIGKYKVKKLLATHGPSQVYICEHPTELIEVVVKMIFYPAEIPANIKKRSIEKFEQEFALMIELNGHPNVCQCYEYDMQWTYPYAAIEYIDGQSVRSFFKHHTTSIEDKINIIQQIIEAIAYVQKNQIVHGDIHLSNFIVTKDFKIKLIDFGLSNHLELQENEIVRNGGVHDYIPPERIKMNAFSHFKERGDFRSEVFQLGIMAYYILYGKYPFTGFTWKELANSILEDGLIFESYTFDQQPIPSELLDTLQKALEKDPSLRFENAQKLGENIFQFV